MKLLRKKSLAFSLLKVVDRVKYFVSGNILGAGSLLSFPT